MISDNSHIRHWITMGIICGITVSLIYPLLIFVPLPFVFTTFLVALFGPLLGLSSFGLYLFLRIHNHTISSLIAVIANAIAGMMITTMLLVQIAIRTSKPDILDNQQQWIWKSINTVHLGLDVSWDIYFCW